MTHTIKTPKPRTQVLQVTSRSESIPCGDGGGGHPTSRLCCAWGGRWRGPWRGRGRGCHSSGAGHGHAGRQGAVVSGYVNPWRGRCQAVGAVGQHVVAVVHGCHCCCGKTRFGGVRVAKDRLVGECPQCSKKGTLFQMQYHFCPMSTTSFCFSDIRKAAQVTHSSQESGNAQTHTQGRWKVNTHGDIQGSPTWTFLLHN